MSKDNASSSRNSDVASPNTSPYQLQVTPSKELLQQYQEDPARVSILPLIERKMNYSHKPRRSVLASYERLAEYRDLLHSVPGSPENGGVKTASRKSKMPLNLILAQDEPDEPNPLGATLRTSSAARDSDHSSASPQNQLISPIKRQSGFSSNLAEVSEVRKEYFSPAESSFKMVEPKKFNSPKMTRSKEH